uniref:UDP-glucose 4-epimerase n=1 Tax=Spongospora subterranea TaxID=70186 RepID=A0A0H5RCF7_9EUKA|eukprot:CRZ06189.1 hypothetical protein [Spongospora subterranea]
MVILITGGAGYVGSHTAVQLTQDGHEVVLIDNFSNSTRSSVDRIRALAGFDIPFHQADLTDDASLEAVFALYNIDVVIHSAALSAIRESVRKVSSRHQVFQNTPL